jgi:UDP-GlcNAc:undecaprenyl-phosphate/decaprenyl-phosphate GlcNAc-1-phosphate transferase
MMSHCYIGSFLTPFFLALLLIPLIKPLAIKSGFIQKPSNPQTSSYKIPLGGGLTIFLGLIFVVIGVTSLATFSDIRSISGLMAGAILVFLIGIYDDIYKMGIWAKMLGQILAALIFLSFLERVPPVMSLPAYFVFGTVWIVGLQNAFDFLDNMDGLCAGVSLSIAIGLGALFVLRDMPLFAVISFALAGGALGFLRYNFPPAGIYLGSTGSLLFGYALSCLAIVHLTSSQSLSSALAPLLIMAYPIFDLTFVTVSRLNDGRKVYMGGKDHSSHKISFLGLTRKATVFAILSVNMLLVALGIVLFFIAESAYQTLIIVALALILAFLGTHLYRNILYLRQKISFILLDIVAINCAFIAYLFVKYPQGPFWMFVAPQDLVILLAWINVFWIMVYSTGGIYDLPVELKFGSHIKALLRVVFVGSLIFMLATYRGGEGIQVSLASLALYAIILIVCNAIFRLAFYTYLGLRQIHPENRMEAVIVKLHQRGICSPVFEFYNQHYRIKGYVGEPPASFEGFLGDRDNLGEILRDNHLARIIFDIPEDNYENLTPIFNSAFYMETRYLTKDPGNDNLKGLHKYPTRHKGIYLISNSQKRIFARLAKRILDFFISGALLILCSPYMMITLRRVYNGKYDKIRRVTLVTRTGFEKKNWCIISKDGKCCFRNPWGLLAVFKGDLSLVGATITVKNGIGEDCPEELSGQWRKYLVKPGIFGPGYSGKNSKERFDLDLEYIEKASLLRDLGIIFKQMSRSSSIKVDEGARS